MKHCACLALALLFLISCHFSGGFEEEIQITNEYIINKNWSKDVNSIEIERMVLKKDSTLDTANLNQLDLRRRLKVDSSFIFVANVKIPTRRNYKNTKIYFNRDNGFFWYTRDGESRRATLGNLEKGKWYRFSRLLTHNYDVYVYIDSSNKAHTHDYVYANF